LANLSKNQIEFLARNNITFGEVFDATGLRKNEYRKVMKILDKNFAFGVAPCRKYGHTLRTRAGHCIQCDTSKIAYQRRWMDELFIYVAESKTINMIKIGVCSEINGRERNLRGQNYGGTSDWKIIHAKLTKNGGKVEARVHILLKEYFEPTYHIKNQKRIECMETFSCSAQIGINAISEILKNPIEEIAPKK